MVMMMAHVEDDNNLDIFRGSGLTVYGRPVGEFYWYRQPTLSSVTVILPLGGERDGYSAEFHRDYPTAEYNTWRRPQQEGTRDGRLLEANLGSASVLSFADFFYADNRSFQAPSGATLSCKYYRQGG